jgi:hypothetical protein
MKFQPKKQKSAKKNFFRAFLWLYAHVRNYFTWTQAVYTHPAAAFLPNDILCAW